MKAPDMFSQHYVLEEDGTVRRARTPEEALAQWDSPRRRIDRTALPGGVEVSTVFLVIDHGLGDGPPLVFETMVFGEEDGPRLYARTSTRGEAERLHLEAVAEVRRAIQ